MVGVSGLRESQGLRKEKRTGEKRSESHLAGQCAAGVIPDGRGG